MTRHRGVVTGDLRMTQDGRMHGMVNGTLTIAAGCRVSVGGMVNGDVVVEPGAEVEVTGMVNGTIHDRGGSVRISGMVTG